MYLVFLESALAKSLAIPDAKGVFTISNVLQMPKPNPMTPPTHAHMNAILGACSQDINPAMIKEIIPKIRPNSMVNVA